jgi:hypothetical protein
MVPEVTRDPRAQEHFARLRALLDEVNAEDRHCLKRVYRGLCAGLAGPGPLSHLERPNYDFARYIDAKLRGD